MREPSAIMTAADKKEQIRDLKTEIKEKDNVIKVFTKERVALQKKLDVLAPKKIILKGAA